MPTNPSPLTQSEQLKVDKVIEIARMIRSAHLPESMIQKVFDAAISTTLLIPLNMVLPEDAEIKEAHQPTA